MEASFPPGGPGDLHQPGEPGQPLGLRRRQPGGLVQGHGGALDERQPRSRTALVRGLRRILRRPGQEDFPGHGPVYCSAPASIFAILGPEEACNGDMARRAGNEYLAQMLIQQNVETLNGYKPGRILTGCPHCFNIIKNEYPQFGGGLSRWSATPNCSSTCTSRGA